ncbi:MAG: HlyD family efflux transporter periplasmic adaptor subunit [Candidatus Omnitrophota bacterium]
MRNKKILLFLVLIIAAGAAAAVYVKAKNKGAQKETTKIISPTMGDIKTYISTTGTVLPQNRLEVKPPVNGRVESIQVQEGQAVKAGEILAWMSSTDRAALLDAARGQGAESLKYWQETYKPIPLLSPIDGQVIVATVQPGQTVTTAEAVVVLSDHLIVRAQVDETDIGKITLKQSAAISLDAYPDANIKAAVEHIYYESQTINNVTIYNVDLLPESVPAFFRSGMNTTVDFLAQDRKNVLLIPVEAVRKDKDSASVMVSEGAGEPPSRRKIKLGITDDKNYEVLSGLDISDKVVVKTKKYVLPKNSIGSNPFSPFKPPAKKKAD